MWSYKRRIWILDTSGCCWALPRACANVDVAPALHIEVLSLLFARAQPRVWRKLCRCTRSPCCEGRTAGSQADCRPTTSCKHNSQRSNRPAAAQARNNKIASLFPGVGRLTKLTLLDLSDNNLTSLPAELADASSLRALPLNGNPLRSIRPELISGPLQALLKYLRSR